METEIIGLILLVLLIIVGLVVYFDESQNPNFTSASIQ